MRRSSAWPRLKDAVGASSRAGIRRNTPGGEECAGFHLAEAPTKIAEHCSLSKMAERGAAYAKLSKKCGRRRARLRARKRLGEILRAGGCYEASAKGFYTHKSRGISLTLAYSDLGPKYKDTAGIEHLARRHCGAAGPGLDRPQPR